MIVKSIRIICHRLLVSTYIKERDWCKPNRQLQRKMTIYYFAYGSNLNPDRMRLKGVDFTARTLAKLSNYGFRLNINVGGATTANVQRNENSCVYGALYTCSNDCLEKLDVFEMVDRGVYRRENVKVELHDGTSEDAVMYIGLAPFIDNSTKTVSRPYLNHILCGRDILPTEYVQCLETFRSWCCDWHFYIFFCVSFFIVMQNNLEENKFWKRKFLSAKIGLLERYYIQEYECV